MVTALKQLHGSEVTFAIKKNNCFQMSALVKFSHAAGSTIFHQDTSRPSHMTVT